MAGSLNKVILIGNLGKDPELKMLPSGQAVANFSLATTESWKNAQGERQSKTEWHQISIFGKLAETAEKWLRKGQSLMVEGRINYREYTDQQGQTYTGFGLMFGAEEATVGSRLRYSWNNAVDFVRIVRLSLQMLVTGEAGLKDVSGPVGIVSTITDVGEQAESASAAVENIAYLAALVAVNLAVMNLLPLPALDGGKIFFLVVNALCMLTIRKKIPAKFESYVHLAGFALLMLLMLVITFQDVWKLFQ